MHEIDAQTVRKAVELACGAADCAPASRISTICKVLTPGTRARVTAEMLTELGYATSCNPREGLMVSCPANSRPESAPGGDEKLRLAYAFALANTKGAPFPGWVAFDLFSSGMHMLDPAYPSGRKLRRVLDSHPEWAATYHAPVTRGVTYYRIPGRDSTVLDDWEEPEPVVCGRDDPGAYPVPWTRREREIHYVRPRHTDELPRQLHVLLPDGGLRPGPEDIDGLGNALAAVLALPRYVLEAGLRIRISRVSDGAVDRIVTFSRERDGWLLEDGSMVPEPDLRSPFADPEDDSQD